MGLLHTQPIIQPFEYLTDPRAVLDYGDRYIDVCDHITYCVSVDLLFDCHIHTVQPAYNILVFEAERDLTMGLLYMSRYTAFVARAV